jgi:hypothetical protein
VCSNALLLLSCINNLTILFFRKKKGDKNAEAAVQDKVICIAYLFGWLV